MIMENRILALLPKAYFPGSVYFGKNSLLYLKSLENQKNLIIISKTVWSKYGEKLRVNLSKCENEFFPFASEPKKSDVEELDKKVKEGGYTNVMGIGGGSVIDLAKTARLENDVKLVMIPTTAGTGSEVSRFSLVLDGDKKEIITSQRLVPDVVLLDPNFLVSLPAFETVYTSLDALSHALEGLVSRMANPFTDSLAIKAMDMILGNLEKSWENGNDIEARENLQVAGFLAGVVQSSASVGIVHSFAHYFGPKLGMPHGAAIGCFLTECLKFNSARTDKYTKLDGSCVVNSENFVHKLESIMDKTGFYHYCGKFDFPDINFHEAAERIKNDVCTRTNPCAITEDDVREIIERVMKHVQRR
jgi:alcohol dehydrogenase class IV